MIYNDYIKLFITSSSIFFTIFPILYLNNAYNQLTDFEKDHLTVSLSSVAILIPIIYGIVFSIIYANIKDKIPKSLQYMKFFIIGALGGFIVSLIFIYVFKIPEQWFKISNSVYWIGYISIFYGILMYILGPLLFNSSSSYRNTVNVPISTAPVGSNSGVMPTPPRIHSPSVNTSSNIFDKLKASAMKK